MKNYTEMELKLSFNKIYSVQDLYKIPLTLTSGKLEVFYDFRMGLNPSVIPRIRYFICDAKHYHLRLNYISDYEKKYRSGSPETLKLGTYSSMHMHYATIPSNTVIFSYRVFEILPDTVIDMITSDNKEMCKLGDELFKIIMNEKMLDYFSTLYDN